MFSFIFIFNLHIINLFLNNFSKHVRTLYNVGGIQCCSSNLLLSLYSDRKDSLSYLYMWIILLHITNLKGSSKQIKVPTHQHYSKIQSNETLHWDDVRQGWLAFGLGELGCCQGRHLLEGAVVYWCRSSLNRNTGSMVTWQTHLSGIPSNCLGFLLIMTAVIVIRRHECMISPFEITEMEILPRNRFQGLFLPHNQPHVYSYLTI